MTSQIKPCEETDGAVAQTFQKSFLPPPATSLALSNQERSWLFKITCLWFSQLETPCWLMVHKKQIGISGVCWSGKYFKAKISFFDRNYCIRGKKDKPSSKHRVMLQLVFKGQQIISPLKISRPSDTQDCNVYQNVFKVDKWSCHKDKYNSCF